MRASVRRERHLSVPADAAWSVIHRGDLLHLWFPGIVGCDVEGATRTITLGTGISLVEQLLTNDSLQRRFQYRIDGGLFREHLATIDVLELDEGSCLVTYATDADPATMAIVLGGAMTSALAELARQLEADAGPVVDALRTTTIQEG